MSSAEIVITSIAGVSALGIAYTYIGYPMLIRLLAALRPRKVDAQPWRGSVSVVLVARNAEEVISAKLQNLLSQKGEWTDLEIIVASDGSTDSTASKVQGCDSPAVKLIEFKDHRGKAAVLNEVLPQCKGEIIVLCDSRQRFETTTAAELCSNFADPGVGAVSGELCFEEGDGAGIGKGLSTYWDMEKSIRKAESRYHSVIGCTGAVYAVRKACFKPLDPSTVLDDVAIPMNIILEGKRVVFNPGARAWDKPEENPAREAARKVRTLTGNIQLCALYPELLNPSANGAVFQFFSHKLMRLFAPWLLVMLLACTAALSRIYVAAGLLTAAQLAFYSLAMSGIALKSPRLAVLKLPATFLLLNFWAAIAPFHYWRGKLSPKWR